MHLSEHDLAAVLHEEPGGEELGAHVASCDACTARLRAVRDEDRRAAVLLALLDHPVPDIDAATVMASRRQSRPWPVKLLAAGVVFLLISAGVAAAIPSSPFHRYLVDVIHGMKPDASIARNRGGVLPEPQETASLSASPSGVVFAPDSSLEIVFKQTQRAGSVRVTIGDAAFVSVKSLNGSGSFDLGRREIVEDNAGGSGDFTVTIPESLRFFVIRVGRDTIFERTGSEVITVGTREGARSFVLGLFPQDWKAPTTHFFR